MPNRPDTEEYFLPKKHAPGEYFVTRLKGAEGGYRLLYILDLIVERWDTYRIYNISRAQFSKMTAVYGADGTLKNIGISEGDSRRFIYLSIPDAETAENIVRHTAERYGREIARQILARGERARRLFAEYSYDELLDYHVILATEKDVQKVYDGEAAEYGEEIIDRSGEYSHVDTKLNKCDEEHISVILSCVPRDTANKCRVLAVSVMEECVKSIIPRLDRTDDFKFISKEYD